MAIGRNFSSAFATDSLGLIINKSAAKALSWNPNIAVDKTVVGVGGDKGEHVPFHVMA